MIQHLTLWYAFNDAGIPYSIYEWAFNRWPDKIKLGLMLYEQWFYDSTLSIENRSLSASNIIRIIEQYSILPQKIIEKIDYWCIDIELKGFWWTACTAGDTKINGRPYNIFKLHQQIVNIPKPPAKIGWYGIPEHLYLQKLTASENRISEQYLSMSFIQDVFYPSLYCDDRLTTQQNKTRNQSMVLGDDTLRALNINTHTVPIVSRWRTNANGDRATTPLSINDFITSQVSSMKNQGITELSLWDSNDWPIHGSGNAENRCMETIQAIADNLGWKPNE